MNVSNSPFRQLPAVHELIVHPRLQRLSAARGHDRVLHWTRRALEDLRTEIRHGADTIPPTPEVCVEKLVLAIVQASEREAAGDLGPVINATGVVLHTGLGRAPLSEKAISAVCEAARACNLEVDLISSERQHRGDALQPTWQRLTGAEASLIVNNNAATTVLVLDALCRGREVIISRGQLIEIGGSFRLPEIFAQSGAILREVGTTNRTRLADYAEAITPNTAAILRVHPSNYRVVGFADTPDIDELSRLARRRELLCFDDIGSGCLVETKQFGLPREPTFAESLQAGADLVLGSGDKLLGGPQAGILLGRAALIDRLRKHPLARAFRVDKMTLAAMTATLDSYLRGAAESELPTLVLLGASAESLHHRAEQIRAAVAIPHHGRGEASGIALSHNSSSATPSTVAADSHMVTTRSSIADRLKIAVARDTAMVGGGSLPGATLPTAVLRLKHEVWSADDLARRLRLGEPRVFGRIHDDDVLLDLRSVMPDDDVAIVTALRSLEGEGT